MTAYVEQLCWSKIGVDLFEGGLEIGWLHLPDG
jgi:hypothetical protein